MEIQIHHQDACFLKLAVTLALWFYSFFRSVGTYKTSIFKWLTGKDNTLLIASCAETSLFVKNILPIECILPLISLPWASFDAFFISSLMVSSGWHKYGFRYASIAYSSATNCKFILDLKSFKITVLYGPMLTSYGFRLYNIESFFPKHPNALSHCSTVTPHSSKISDCVTSDRSFIVTI